MTQGKSSVKNANDRKKIVLEKPRDTNVIKLKGEASRRKISWGLSCRDLRT